MIATSKRCVALTGAGISTASGIPDFRSPSGLWARVNPMETAHIDVWRRAPERFWDFYWERLDVAEHYQPNAAHLALTALQRAGRLAGLITQNIDGLHQKAGSADVVEVHGSVRKLVCRCGYQVDRQHGRELAEANGVPYCPCCGEPLKPDVTLFGEVLPQAAIERAFELADGCDLMLCIGSSLEVMPVAELPAQAQASGAQLVVITHLSHYDELADVHLDGEIVDELDGVMQALGEIEA
jgi:NAD-dependent deacetylase